MNNPNSQSQNPNIQNQNPIVNNFLAEYLKNNSNPMIQQANTSNASESAPIPSANLEPQAAQYQKDLLNNMLQKQMLANIFSSNAPLINGINGLLRPPGANPLEKRKSSVDGRVEVKGAIGGESSSAHQPQQSFADFAQFAQAQNYALQFQNSQIMLNEKQIFSGSFAANGGPNRKAVEPANNASDSNNELESIVDAQAHESNFNKVSNINNNVNNKNSNEEGINSNCVNSGVNCLDEEKDKKENEQNTQTSNAKYHSYSGQGNFQFPNADANNANNNVSNMNNLNTSSNQNQFNFPFNPNMHMNANNSLMNLSANNNQERAAAAGQLNNPLNNIENLPKMNNSFSNNNNNNNNQNQKQTQAMSGANNSNFPFNFIPEQSQNQMQNMQNNSSNSNNNTNILNILQLLMNNGSNNNNKPKFPSQMDPKIINMLLTSNPNNPLAQNLIQSLMQNNQKLNPLSAFNAQNNIPIPLNISSNISNNAVGGVNANNPMNFINALGSICKPNNNLNNNNFNVNNNNNSNNNLNSNPEQSHISVSGHDMPASKEQSNKLQQEENQVINTQTKQAAVNNQSQTPNNNASVKSNSAFNNQAGNLNNNAEGNINGNNTKGQSIPNPNFLIELLSKNLMNNTSKDKESTSNNSNLINNLIQSQMKNQQGNNMTSNNPLANLMSLASNSNTNISNNPANFLNNLGANFNQSMLLNNNPNAFNNNNNNNNTNQNINNINILQKLLGMASNNINPNQSVQNPQTKSNPNTISNQAPIANLSNLNNLAQSSNSNITNLSNNPLLGLLSIITGGGQKANSNPINPNSNTNNLLNASLINSQINSSTSNQLKDIANTLPLLGVNFPAQAAKAENSLSSPDSGKNAPNAGNQSKQAGIQSIPSNIQGLLNFLSLTNDLAANKGNISGQSPLQVKDEMMAKNAGKEGQTNFDSSSANSLFKLSSASNQNNVTNFNIFNNLFNIPALNYGKPPRLNNASNSGKNAVEDFKNNLLNIGALNNLVNKGQNNSSVNNSNNSNLNLNNINSNNANASHFSANNAAANLNGIFAINNPANNAKNNLNSAAGLAGLFQNNKIFNNFNTANNMNNNSNLNNFNNISNNLNNAKNLGSNNPNNINSLNSLANQLQGNILIHKHFKATPVHTSNELKNFSTGQNSISNIQNNLNNLSDKQQQQQQNYVRQVKYPLEDMELVKDPRSYAIDPKLFVRPEAKRIEIEHNLLNKIIIVWDFLTNFNDLIAIDEGILSLNFFDFLNKISCKSFYIPPAKDPKAPNDANVIEMELEQNPKQPEENEINQNQNPESFIKSTEGKENNQSNAEENENENKIKNNDDNKVEDLKEPKADENPTAKRQELVLNVNENYQIFEKILIQLSKLYSNSLKESDITDDVKVDKDLFIIKFCSENNFSDIESFYEKCYPEILRILVNSRRFGLMANEKVKTCVFKNLKALGTEERIEVLFYLVNSAFDLTSIKQQIKYEGDLRNDLLRERNTLDYELKTKENRKREIEKMEKFITAPSKIELLTERINKLDENPDEILKIYKETNITKLKKDLDVERERYKGLLKENDELGNVRNKIMSRLDEIRTELNNLNLRNKKKIGQDYQKNDYYVFEKIPHYLFIYNKNENFKPGLGFINSDNPVNTGFWGFYDSFDDVVLISNCLTEKGIREKALKSALKKLISKKFFAAEVKENLEETNLFTVLNEKYKEVNQQKNLSGINSQNEPHEVIEEKNEQTETKILVAAENNQMDLELNLNKKENKGNENKNEQEPDKPNTAVNLEDNQAAKIEANIISDCNFNSKDVENINEIEKQNKMLNEIMDDIQNIDNLKNNLDNILENEAHIDLIQDDFIDVNCLQQTVAPGFKAEENKNNDSQMVMEKAESEAHLNFQAINEANAKSKSDLLADKEFTSKLDYYQNEKDERNQKQLDFKNENRNVKMEVEESNEQQVELVDSEKDLGDLSELKDKLLAMEDKFTEYLKQYEKEWESPIKRLEWRKFIEENHQFYNIFLSIKMLNFRFKNPYRSDEPPASDEDLNHEENPSFVFKGINDNESFKIFEFDNTRLLAPKVKIWSRDLEANEMEKYFCESILENISNIPSLYIAYFLFEGAVYGLIKRRDPYKKSNLRDNMGLDLNNLNYTNSSQQFNYNIEETSYRKADENDYFDNNAENNQEDLNKSDKNIAEKQVSQSFNTSNTNNIINPNTTNTAQNSSRTRSTRLMNPVNYNLNYNLNNIFNQAGLSNENIRAAGKTASRPKTKSEKQNKESFNDDSKHAIRNESDLNTENNNKYLEEDNIDETLSDNNVSKKKKKKASSSKTTKKKLLKASSTNSNNKKRNEIDEIIENAAAEDAESNNGNKDNNLDLPEGNEKTDTLSENFSENEEDKKPSNISSNNINANKSSKKTSAANQQNNKKEAQNNKKLLGKKSKRIQDEELEEDQDISSPSTPDDADEEDYSESFEKGKKGAKNAKKGFSVNSKTKSASLPVKRNNNKSKNISDANLNENSSSRKDKITEENKIDIDEEKELDDCKDDNNPDSEVLQEENENENNKRNKGSFAKNKNSKKDLTTTNKNSSSNTNNFAFEDNDASGDYNINQSKAGNKAGKQVSRYLNKTGAAAEEESNITSVTKGKRVTRSLNTEAIKGKWKEKCYICFQYGDLLCCEECSNVAHKFCACVDKIPDKWYCQKCLEKNPNNIKEKEEN